ncbi:MAG TPA: energy-coupled thiamine transporter ThiT, partial [Oscillospiraceae bacterium]|nr:energy-coupled thiamine transporter ThiT [Oscillospiraceae bacterium]
MNGKNATRMICEGALMIAAAQVLGYIKVFQLPQGGSVSLGMLPIFLFAVRWGLGSGLMAGVIYGVLQFLLDGGIALGWQCILGDYVLAYGMLGFAGLFRGRENGFAWGVLLGSFLRFLCHFTTGVTIWAQYMPDEFFGLTMTSPYFYSLLYNGSYILGEVVLILAVGVLLKKRLRRYLLG